MIYEHWSTGYLRRDKFHHLSTSCRVGAAIAPTSTSTGGDSWFRPRCGLSMQGWSQWVVSAAKLQPPFSSPALRSLHGRPDRSGSLRSTDLQSLSLSLSRPHLANDEAHALYHGYACSETTSASLRPKLLSLSDTLYVVSLVWSSRGVMCAATTVAFCFFTFFSFRSTCRVFIVSFSVGQIFRMYGIHMIRNQLNAKFSSHFRINTIVSSHVNSSWCIFLK